MARLWAGVALALLAVVVGTGVQANALGARSSSSERSPSSQLLAQAQAGKRSALVIGNGAYTDIPLDNAVNDAEAVARTLQEIGFSVTLVRNADRRTIDEAVEAFSRRLGPNEIGLFYFSGHGVQVDGENYLVPINAQLRRQSDAQYDAVPLGKVMNAVETTRASSKIFILDACRENPFIRRWRSTGRGGTAQGLATPRSSGEGGTLIAFSTAPGKVAADGVGTSSNSPFTASLLRHLRTPNLEVGQLFRRVRGDVMEATGKQQIPWVLEALIGEVIINHRPPGVAAEVADGPASSRQQPAPSPQTQPAPQRPTAAAPAARPTAPAPSQPSPQPAANLADIARDNAYTSAVRQDTSVKQKPIILAIGSWSIFTEPGYQASKFLARNNGFSVHIDRSFANDGAIPWGVQVKSTSPIKLEKGRSYTLRFRVQSSSSFDLLTRLGEFDYRRSIFKNVSFSIDSGDKPKMFSFTFLVDQHHESSELYFQLGNVSAGSTIVISDILIELGQ